MEQISDRFFAKKLYFQQLSVYGTIGFIMLLPYLLQPYFSLPVASFLSFFVVVTLRALFETCVLYEVSFGRVSVSKILVLSLATAGLMTFFLVLVKPKLGWYAIPLSIIFASTVVGKLKTKLWPNGGASSEPFAQLAEKIRLNTTISYAFYAIFVPITVISYVCYHVWFFAAVFFGYFVGAVFEELCVSVLLYAKRLVIRNVCISLLWSACCAGLAALVIWATTNLLGLEGQAATIIGIITLKLVQPLRRIISSRGNLRTGKTQL